MQMVTNNGSPGKDRRRAVAFTFAMQKAVLTERTLKPDQKMLLLAFTHNDFGFGRDMYPSAATLATATGTSEATVWRRLKALLAGGWLVKTSPGGGGFKKTTHYRFGDALLGAVAARMNHDTDKPSHDSETVCVAQTLSSETETLSAQPQNPLTAAPKPSHHVEARTTKDKNYKDRTTKELRAAENAAALAMRQEFERRFAAKYHSPYIWTARDHLKLKDLPTVPLANFAAVVTRYLRDTENFYRGHGFAKLIAHFSRWAVEPDDGGPHYRDSDEVMREALEQVRWSEELEKAGVPHGNPMRNSRPQWQWLRDYQELQALRTASSTSAATP